MSIRRSRPGHGLQARLHNDHMTSAPTAKVARAPWWRPSDRYGHRPDRRVPDAVPGAWGPAPVTLTTCGTATATACLGCPGQPRPFTGSGVQMRVALSPSGSPGRRPATTRQPRLGGNGGSRPGQIVGAVPTVTGVAKVAQTSRRSRALVTTRIRSVPADGREQPSPGRRHRPTTLAGGHRQEDDSHDHGQRERLHWPVHDQRRDSCGRTTS